MSLHSYKELIVWQKSIHLVKEVYLIKFPQSEIYALSSQMRRAVVSIPSNIAEGYGRTYKKEYYQFLSMAYGSGLELETQLIICRELRFIDEETYQRVNGLLQEVLKMLYVMKRPSRNV